MNEILRQIHGLFVLLLKKSPLGGKLSLVNGDDVTVAVGWRQNDGLLCRRQLVEGRLVQFLLEVGFFGVVDSGFELDGRHFGVVHVVGSGINGDVTETIALLEGCGLTLRLALAAQQSRFIEVKSLLAGAAFPRRIGQTGHAPL